MRAPFPLQWPPNWPRTPPKDREASRFVTGMARAIREVLAELSRLGAANVVITSDLPTKTNGLPYAQADREATDSGIAVWFVLDGEERVQACDRWRRAAENLHAIALTIAAIRGISRWGSVEAVNRAFAGFKALPPAPSPERPWWVVLCIQRDVLEEPLATLAKARRAHRMLIRALHPDVEGGDTDRAAEINVAFAEAERELEAAEAKRVADAVNGAAP